MAEISSLVLHLCQMIKEEKTVSSKYLAKRACMLTHWKTALDNMQGLDLIVLLWKKNFRQMNYTPILVLTFDDSGVPMFIAMMVFCLFYSVKSTQVSVATSLSFYNIFFNLKMLKEKLNKSFSFTCISCHD